ncbi:MULTISPECIES: FAD-dependent monooxygenase [unclassified Mesorhizobium]|uniref:FAD-dependent monooxygenase n=1 Tax=unclassified Mesorhizobium TaxID=325217 RepID=UPI001127F8FE|nr:MULTISPECIES: FAD-dependent monooxygenase [unclassified Mesorhizobium]MBZ9974104.1 FAD-dependent monooxygenase [Mesorhizobium sp. BR-1-1-10]TPK10378.1 FAD-binding monooxygenase [Mesorhizobium sp. B2-5-7]
MPALLSPRSTVLVVGAGPTGLALALSLATAGVPVRLVDSKAAPSTTSRAIGIQARTLELLDLFGLAEAFVSLGLRARAGNIYAQSRQLVHLDLSCLQSRYPFILLLEQTETERLLTEALVRKGVQIERDVALLSFKQDDGGVDVQLSQSGAGPVASRYAYMVGCDGAHSITRHGLDLGFYGKTLRQKFVLADLDVRWQLPNDQFHIFTAPEGLMAIFPMRSGHRLVAETLKEPTTSANRPTLSQLQDLAAQRTAVEMTLSNLRWSSFFQVNSRLATRLRQGRVFLAGDAAHIHSPAGAQGMNTGIQDALNLAWKLAFVLRGDAAPELLDSYQSERYPVEQGVLRKTEILTKMVSLRAPPLRYVRDLIVPPLARTRLVQSVARKTISQIGISYRRGRLLEGLGAGDRMPDAEVELEADGTRPLYSLLDGAHFKLLLVSCNDVSSLGASIAALVPNQIAQLICARCVHSHEHQDLKGSFVLIRPDAYVAQVGPISRVAEAIDWLSAHLQVKSH